MSSNFLDLSEFDPLSTSSSNPLDTLEFQENHYAERRDEFHEEQQLQFNECQVPQDQPTTQPADQQSADSLSAAAAAASPSPLELPSQAELEWFAADANGDMQREAKRHLLRDYLKERQREFTDYSQLLVHCGTWNVNNQLDEQKLDLKDWLKPPNGQPAADVYALGFQELDVSTKTYITQHSDREEKWTRLCQRCFPSSHCYSIVKTVRLFSTFLLVAIKDSLRNQLHSLRFGTQATGLMGFGANKGGTAVRFQLGDTQFTFVNCHLASGEDKLENRMNDLRDIQQKLRLMFDGTGGRYELLSHIGDTVCSHVTYFFGDLNFRLAGTNKDLVEHQLSKRTPSAYRKILDKHDELTLTMAQSRYGIMNFNEANISFPPTYKYQLGSKDAFDSEKLRIPSWCDRILYQFENVQCKPLVYCSYQHYTMSDHKPVACIFSTQMARVDPKRQKETVKRGVKWLDSLENAVLPQCCLEPGHEVDFGQLDFFNTYRASLSLRNTGRVAASWQLLPTPSNEFSGIRATPVESRIGVGKSETILLDAKLGPCQWPQAVRRWAAGKPDPAFASSDVLVIALTGGPHIFAVPRGDILPSCYGLPLDCLCRLRKPVLQTDRESFRSLLKACFDCAGSSEFNSAMGPIVHPVPVEVTRLLEATGDPDSPLLLSTDPSDEDASMPSDSQLAGIADALSRGVELPAGLQPGAVLHALLLLLHLLPDRVLLPVPGARQSQLASDLLSRVFAWARRVLKGPNWRHREALIIRLARALDRPATATSSPSAAAINEVRKGLDPAAAAAASAASSDDVQPRPRPTLRQQQQQQQQDLIQL